MPVGIKSSGGGTTTLVAESSATNYTATLPANSGTVITTGSTFSGTGPAFSAYQSISQTLPSTTYTKIQLQAEDFDTANCFDSTTNYRFTPTVAGYYQINGLVSINSSATQVVTAIYKNGSLYKYGGNLLATGSSIVSLVMFLNGSTDYIELYGYIGTGQALAVGASYLNGAMVRAA